MLEGKYKNFYLNWHRLPMDDPLYQIYEAIAYMIEDIEDFNSQFQEIYDTLKDIEDSVSELEGQTV